MIKVKKFWKSKLGSVLVEKILMVAFSVAAGGAVTVYMANVINENKNGPHIDLEGGTPAGDFDNISKVHKYRLDYFELTAEEKAAVQAGGKTQSSGIYFETIDVSHAEVLNGDLWESRQSCLCLSLIYNWGSSENWYVRLSYGPYPYVQMTGGYIIFTPTESFQSWNTDDSALNQIFLNHVVIYSEV